MWPWRFFVTSHDDAFAHPCQLSMTWHSTAWNKGAPNRRGEAWGVGWGGGRHSSACCLPRQTLLCSCNNDWAHCTPYSSQNYYRTSKECVFYCTKCIIDMDIMVSKKKKCEVGDVRGGWTVRRLHQTSSCHEPQTWRTPVAGALKLYFTREQHPVALPRAAVPRS